jgi:hypothetical protein
MTNRNFFTIVVDRHTKETLFEMTVKCDDELSARISVSDEFKHRMKYAKKSVKSPLVAGQWNVEVVEI